MTTYDNMDRELPARMSHKEAADVLRSFKHNIISKKPMGYPMSSMMKAIDVAIAALEPSIVPTLDNIIQAVTRETGVTEDDMLMRCRCREYAYARYMVFWLAFRYTRTTQTSMAKRFKLKGHVSVQYGIKRGDEWMANPILNDEWCKMTTRIIQSFITDDKD